MNRLVGLLVALLLVACSREEPVSASAPRGSLQPLGSLHYAAKVGDIIQVQRWLDVGADVDALDRDGRTPLHWAADKGFIEVAKLLLERGADVNGKSTDENTPLHLAAGYRSDIDIQNRLAVAALLYAKGAKVTDPKDFVTLLQVAALKGDLATAMKLIDSGVDVNRAGFYDDGNYPALTAAIDGGSAEMVNLLLDRRATFGVYEVRRAICRRQLPLVKLLEARGKPYYLTENWGNVLACGDKAILSYFMVRFSPLDYAAIAPAIDGNADAELFAILFAKDTELTTHFASLPGKAAAAGNAKLLTLGFAKGLSMSEEVAKSVLFLSARYSTPEVLDVLLAQKIPVDSRTGWGNTPLLLVVPRNFVGTAASLLKMGADVNAKNELLNTALHLAAARNLTDMVNLLLKSGATVDARNEDGNTPLLQAARFPEKFDSIKLLLDSKAEINAQNSRGMTALHYLVVRMTSSFEEPSASEMPKEITPESEAPVAEGEVAVQNHQRPPRDVPADQALIEAMKLLLARGADPTIKNVDGKTPLELAREHPGYVTAVKLLEEVASGRRQ